MFMLPAYDATAFAMLGFGILAAGPHYDDLKNTSQPRGTNPRATAPKGNSAGFY